MAYFCPRLEIKYNVSYSMITDKIKETKGEIKDKLNFDELIKSDKIYKNCALVQFFKDKNFIPLRDYYSTDICEIFDVFGGIYDIIENNVTYTISLYFYKIKNVELITQELIKKFSLIFQQTYLIDNNIIDMEYHEYRLSLFFKELSNPKFLDLSYKSNPICKTQLYRYQTHNISRLLEFHNNGISVRFNNNLIMYFDNGLIYDFTQYKFIEESDISLHTINGGIVMDEPGTGKTLQFIIYLIEIILNYNVIDINNDEKALILVPDDDIKKHWLNEFNKHILIPLEDLPICIMTLNEMRKYDIYGKDDIDYIKKIKIIIVDEIHTLWKSYNDILDKLLKFPIKYRWGLSATPFITQNSLINIIEFLTGKHFHNERIANIPRIQNEIMKVFLKNTKFNIKDEYPWADITIYDKKLTFDKIQQDLYNTEAKTMLGIYNLRLLACQMELMFNKDITQSITPKELKLFANTHYKNLYENELAKLEELVIQLKNIHENKDKFHMSEYLHRFQHYENLIKKKEIIVSNFKDAYHFHMNSINKIDNTITGKDIDPDEKCPICMDTHESPITYFKKCGHYFCKNCIDEIFSRSLYKMNSQITCPYCRANINNEDILIVKDKCDITESAKCYEIIKLINNSCDRFIIFTQFPKLIENLLVVLNRNRINAMIYSLYKNKKSSDIKVIILSSEENAAGIDLTEFNNVIIFEPFEDSMYCKEIEKQLIGRIHRINQTKPVNVYRLIMLNTIEEHIYSKYID
jgi:SNF2 family DNA or RNA helicase